MNGVCPKIAKCPLFNGLLLKRAGSEDVYKNSYCNSPTRYKECKRFMISEKFGKCADFILPNCSLSETEIVDRMKKEGVL